MEPRHAVRLIGRRSQYTGGHGSAPSTRPYEATRARSGRVRCNSVVLGGGVNLMPWGGPMTGPQDQDARKGGGAQTLSAPTYPQARQLVDSRLWGRGAFGWTVRGQDHFTGRLSEAILSQKPFFPARAHAEEPKK